MLIFCVNISFFSTVVFSTQRHSVHVNKPDSVRPDPVHHFIKETSLNLKTYSWFAWKCKSTSKNVSIYYLIRSTGHINECELNCQTSRLLKLINWHDFIWCECARAIRTMNYCYLDDLVWTTHAQEILVLYGMLCFNSVLCHPQFQWWFCILFVMQTTLTNTVPYCLAS